MYHTQIKVLYIDGSEGMIDSRRLEELIDSGEISHFRRSDGWVDVIGSKTRTNAGESCPVKERRRDLLSRQTVFRTSAPQDAPSHDVSIFTRIRQFCIVLVRAIANFL